MELIISEATALLHEQNDAITRFVPTVISEKGGSGLFLPEHAVPVITGLSAVQKPAILMTEIEYGFQLLYFNIGSSVYNRTMITSLLSLMSGVFPGILVSQKTKIPDVQFKVRLLGAQDSWHVNTVAYIGKAYFHGFTKLQGENEKEN